MEQYWMPRRQDWSNLRYCIDHYKADSIFIRLVGSMGGTVKVNLDLRRKKLDFIKDKSGLHILVNAKEVFVFPLHDYGKGFSLAYERFFPDGVYFYGRGDEDPNDKTLPKIKRSFLRHVLDDHLMEIYFKGKIPVKFHSWWDSYKIWKIYTLEKS